MLEIFDGGAHIQKCIRCGAFWQANLVGGGAANRTFELFVCVLLMCCNVAFSM